MPALTRLVPPGTYGICCSGIVVLRVGMLSPLFRLAVLSPRGRAGAPIVELRFLATLEVSTAPSSASAPTEYSELVRSRSISGIILRFVSSCRAFILCHVRSLRPIAPSSNSLINKLFWSIASKTSPLISWSLKTLQCAFSTPLSSRYSATRSGPHDITSSSVCNWCSSSSVSAPAIYDRRYCCCAE